MTIDNVGKIIQSAAQRLNKEGASFDGRQVENQKGASSQLSNLGSNVPSTPISERKLENALSGLTAQSLAQSAADAIGLTLPASTDKAYPGIMNAAEAIIKHGEFDSFDKLQGRFDTLFSQFSENS